VTWRNKLAPRDIELILGGAFVALLFAASPARNVVRGPSEGMRPNHMCARGPQFA
jgi:hypothetical protein